MSSLSQNSNNQAHDPVYPEDIRNNDLISAHINFENKYEQVEVWRVSPLGLDLVIDKPFVNQNEFKIKLILNGKSSVVTAIFVTSFKFKNKNIYSFRYINSNEKDDISGEKRNELRWNCSPQFHPTGMANCPAKYNEFIYFKVKNISFTGMNIECSMRNKFLFKGLNLSSIINFPAIGQLNLNLDIKNIKVTEHDGNKFLSIGLTYTAIDRAAREIIANYLLQFSNVKNYRELRDAGFATKKLSKSIKFSYTKTKEEYESVLSLRLSENKKVGKLDDSLTTNDMSDEFDSRSRIILGKYKSISVCTARISFFEEGDSLEIENYVDLPQDFPRKEECTEIMRLCTHNDFRKSDLLLFLMRKTALMSIQANKKYAIISCVEKLKPLYKKIGFKDTGLNYESNLFKGTRDHVMLIEYNTVVVSSKLNPIIWNIVWKDVVEYLIDGEKLSLTPAQMLRVRLLKLLGPIAKVLIKMKKK